MGEYHDRHEKLTDSDLKAEAARIYTETIGAAQYEMSSGKDQATAQEVFKEARNKLLVEQRRRNLGKEAIEKSA